MEANLKKNETKSWSNSGQAKVEFLSLQTFGDEDLMFNKFQWSSTMTFLFLEKTTFTEWEDQDDLQERE